MHNSKLLKSLRKLPARQFMRFGEFLRSPFFNKNQSNITFYEFLEKYAPAFDHPELEKARVLQQRFLEEEAGEKQLAYLMSDLTGLLETFLAVCQFRDNAFGEKISGLKMASLLDMEALVPGMLRKVNEELKKKHWRNNEYFQQCYELTRWNYEKGQRDERNYDANLQVASDALDTYFVVEKLRFCWNMINLENILNVTYAKPLLAELNDWLENDPVGKIPAVEIYRCALKMFDNYEVVEPFFKLKDLMSAHHDLLSPEEQKHLYGGMLNFCTRRINRFADQAFEFEYFEINALLLDRGLILEYGILQIGRYFNLVAAGLKCKRTEWVWQFMHDYKDKLDPDQRENVYHYNLGYYHYYLKNYGEAQRALAPVSFNDVLLNLSLRSLLARIYYETGETELLYAALENIRHYLRRNKLIDPKLKRQLNNFRRFTWKLAEMDFPEEETLAALQAQIPPAPEMMHRDWLLQRIEEKSGMVR